MAGRYYIIYLHKFLLTQLAIIMLMFHDSVIYNSQLMDKQRRFKATGDKGF